MYHARFWRLLSKNLRSTGDKLLQKGSAGGQAVHRNLYTAEFCLTLADAIEDTVKEYNRLKETYAQQREALLVRRQANFDKRAARRDLKREVRRHYGIPKNIPITDVDVMLYQRWKSQKEKKEAAKKEAASK